MEPGRPPALEGKSRVWLLKLSRTRGIGMRVEKAGFAATSRSGSFKRKPWLCGWFVLKLWPAQCTPS